MSIDHSRSSNVLTLREVFAPEGWTAALLQQQLPVDDEAQLPAYREAVAILMERLTPFLEVHPEEVFLQFSRCRPDREIKLLQSHARGWMPEFGVGVWLHGDPPQTWTRDEFEAAEPGTLRPVIERVVRVQRDPGAQLSAWRMLLGSGALLRVSAGAKDAFVAGATKMLLPTISDSSLTSFPFYVPLLEAGRLLDPSAAYDLPLADQLPAVDAYVRESVEDGGLFLLVRQRPEVFWQYLLRTALPMTVARSTLTPS